jgi:hypothetical protein
MFAFVPCAVGVVFGLLCIVGVYQTLSWPIFSFTFYSSVWTVLLVVSLVFQCLHVDSKLRIGAIVLTLILIFYIVPPHPPLPLLPSNTTPPLNLTPQPYVSLRAKAVRKIVSKAEQ